MIAITLVIAAFYGGVFFERASERSLEAERYDWSMHRQLNDPPISCDVLDQGFAVGQYWVQTALNGAAIRVIQYDNASSTITVTLFKSPTQWVTDSWELDCS